MFIFLKTVSLFCESVKDRDTPMTMEFDSSMPTTQRSRVSGMEAFVNDPRITIDKIFSQEQVSIDSWMDFLQLSLCLWWINIESLKFLQKDAFVVVCELTKLQSKDGWTYEGCSKCSSIVKALDENDPESKKFCPRCKKEPNKIEPK